MDTLNTGYGSYSYGDYSYSGSGSDDYVLQDGAPSMNPSPMWPHDMTYYEHTTPFSDQAYDSSYSLGHGASNDAFGSVGTSSGSHTGYTNVGGEAASPFSEGPGTSKKKQRKEKMYNWPKQEDPELERRRLLAIKQKKKRDKDEQEEVQTRVALRKTEEEIENLKTELAMRGCNVAMMEQILTSYGNNDGTWVSGIGDYH